MGVSSREREWEGADEGSEAERAVYVCVELWVLRLLKREEILRAQRDPRSSL